MIIHSVIFKLKHDDESSETKEFWLAAKKLANISGVENFTCLKQTSPKNKFEYGLSMEFENQRLYDNYSNHPDHVQFIEQFWITNVEDFLEIDYEKLLD